MRRTSPEVEMNYFAWARCWSILAAMTAPFAMNTQAAASDLTIFSGGAVKSGLTDAIAAYERTGKKKIFVEYHPMGPLTKMLAEGARPDMVVLTREVMDEVAPKGAVAPDTLTEVGRVGMGVAVHRSAPAPDISTPEAFKRALLAAKSIVYIDPARGTSGKHFAEVLKKLGIAEAVNAKATLGTGGYVVEPVGRGLIELGVHQITEILPVPGVKLVGPLPAELQKETVYLGAATAATPRKAEAQAFLAYLRTSEARKLFAARGFFEGR
jgi:molybdate transport system substrate-binding protein